MRVLNGTRREPRFAFHWRKWQQILTMALWFLLLLTNTPSILALPTYDLNDICSKQTIFNLELTPMYKVLFQLNVTLPNKHVVSSSPDKEMLMCMISFRTPRMGINTTFEIEWNNFHTGCRDLIQIKKPDEKLEIFLNGTGHHTLHMPNAASVNLYLSICRSPAPKHFLRIWTSTSSIMTGNSQNDVSSIILAFMAPFAFILLAVVMAIMGSCCCGKKCQRHAISGGQSTEESGSTSDSAGNFSQPSGSRDILLTAASLADKPPAYADLFPADYIYKEESKAELKSKLVSQSSRSESTFPELQQQDVETRSNNQTETTSKSNAALATVSGEIERRNGAEVDMAFGTATELNTVYNVSSVKHEAICT